MQFWGYKRSDGSVGVRNHVLILPACACASETCRIVASQVEGTKNVIINVGCSDVAANTELTQRVLTGFALNANVYGGTKGNVKGVGQTDFGGGGIQFGYNFVFSHG